MTTLSKLWHLLVPEQRRAAVVLLALMLVGMVLETLGIGLIIPALAVMTQDDLAARYPAVAPWLEAVGNPNREQLIVGGMLTLVGVYTIKTLFLGFLAWWQARFAFELQASLSQRLFTGYLLQPYTFHLQRNSAQLISNVVTETNQFTHSGLLSGMIVLTEIFVLCGISILLLFVEPVGAILVVSTLGLAGWGFNRLTRTRIVRWGAMRQHHEGLRVQHLQQGLGGAKDVKLLGRESDFLAQCEVQNRGIARMGQRQTALQALPRLWLELLAVIGLAALVLVMMKQGKPPDALLPTLGLFAAAAFRLMPSVSRMLSALQGMRYALPVINSLHAELGLLEVTAAPQRGEPLLFARALTLDGVDFRYPNVDTKALSGINLSIPRGATVGVIGGSGSGKSTLVDVILGLLTPESGVVRVDGVDIQTRLRSWQDKIGYVHQSIFLTDDSLRRNIAFGLSNDQIDDAAVWRALRAAQLEQYVRDLPAGIDSVVGERGIRLSGGQRQRIGIARALYHDPEVLVLDEATSSLDTETERGIMESVRALHGKKTIIIVAHRLSTVEHCDRLFRIEQGRVVQEGEMPSVLGKGSSGPAGRMKKAE